MIIGDVFDRESLEEKVLLALFPNIDKLPYRTMSPLRADSNKNLSFSIYKKDKQIWWIDFATSEYGTIFELCEKVLGKEKLSEILNQKYEYELIRFNERERTIDNTIIEFKKRTWQKYDDNYWYAKYGLDREFLEWCNVYPISLVCIKKGTTKRYVNVESNAYAYTEEPNFVKIYQPLSKSCKWLSNYNSDVVELMSKTRDEGDDIIITSSRKDAMVIRKFLNIDAIALASETTKLKQSVVDDLKNRFADVYTIYDNDFGKERNTGKEMSENIAEKYGIKAIRIPSVYGAKDPSDFVEKHGQKLFKEVFKALLKQKEIIKNTIF